jgi:VanZ family protein
MKKYAEALLRGLCFASALVLIFCLFWLGAKPEVVALFPRNPPLDKVVHMLVFGLIAALLWLSTRSGQPYPVFAVVMAVAAADELHQRYLPGRIVSLTDFAANLAGVLLVLLLLELARRRNERSRL